MLELLPTVGWGLACVPPLVSHLVVGGLVERCARRSLCFLGEPQCTSTQGSSVGAVLQPVCATLRCSRPAPRHPLLFITRRGKIDDDDDDQTSKLSIVLQFLQFLQLTAVSSSSSVLARNMFETLQSPYTIILLL